MPPLLAQLNTIVHSDLTTDCTT